jgi:hypothetical protein
LRVTGAIAGVTPHPDAAGEPEAHGHARWCWPITTTINVPTPPGGEPVGESWASIAMELAPRPVQKKWIAAIESFGRLQELDLSYLLARIPISRRFAAKEH